VLPRRKTSLPASARRISRLFLAGHIRRSAKSKLMWLMSDNEAMAFITVVVTVVVMALMAQRALVRLLLAVQANERLARADLAGLKQRSQIVGARMRSNAYLSSSAACSAKQNCAA
jgi:hypothetical protein